MMTQYCTFYLGKELFGVDILDVQEITRNQEITPIPHAPAVVEGLINLRGQIVVTVNLRTAFSMEGFPVGLEPIHIIFSMNREPLSLLADRAGDVLEYHKNTMVPPPAPLVPHVAKLIVGVHKLDGRLLHVLQPKTLFSQTDRIMANYSDTHLSPETK